MKLDKPVGPLIGLAFVWLATTPGVVSAQYRCDWNVNGIGGGDMSSTSYRSRTTAGQTAIGPMSSSTFLALIGFWQTGIDDTSGVEEAARWSGAQVLQTSLRAPRPNPMRGGTTIHYTLDAEHLVSIQIHDLAGRVVRTLCNARMKRGAHRVTWNGASDRGWMLGNGIYFCKFHAGGYRATEKLVKLE